MDKFLERQKLLKLIQEEIENMNRPIRGNWISNFKTFHKKRPDPEFTGEF